jgi:trans-aconitate 2-methyltransferase
MYVLCMYCVNGIEHNVEFQKQDWNAEYYEENSSFQYNVAMSVISKIQCEGNEYIFDIGCGNGKITQKLAKKVPHGIVQGIDISENMIMYARSHYVLSNLFFDIADIANFSSGVQYDFVVAFSSLAWVKDQDQALRTIEKILKPGGIFIATMDNEDDPYLRARCAMFTHDTWKHFFKNYEVLYYPFNEDKIKNLLQQAGFVNIMISKITMPSLWVTRDSFIGMLSAIPAQKDMIPLERHKEFFDDIVDEYVKEVPLDSDGNIELIFTEFIVTAEKVIN